MTGSASGVKAGQAYVLLTLRDQASAALAGAKARFMAFSRGMATAGGMLAGAGAGGLAAIGGAVSQFMSIGGELQDVSEKTGLSAEQLTALQFGAEQAGIGLEALQGGLRGIARLTHGAATGSKQAGETLRLLGVSAHDFVAATPANRMAMIADGLSKIRDPSERAAVAMRALGRGGVDLLPILQGGSAGLNSMSAEASRLGLVLSSDAVRASDELGDAWGVLTRQGKILMFQVGAALAEPLTKLVKMLQQGAAWVIQFVQNNQGLVRVLTIAAVGAVLLGGALIALAAAGAMLAGIVAGISAAMTVAAAVFSPIGLKIMGIALAVLVVIAVIAAGIYAFFKYTEIGQWMAGEIGKAFMWLWGVVKQVMGGISDALMAGDWKLAAQIAWAGVQVVYYKAVEKLMGYWHKFLANFKAGWVIISTWFSSAVVDMAASFISGLNTIQDYIVSWANSAAEALGLSVRFDGLDSLKSFNDSVQAGSAVVKDEIARKRAEDLKQIERDRVASDSPYVKASDDAQKELDKLTDRAAALRAKSAAKLAVAAPKFAGGGGGLLSGSTSGSSTPAGGVLGTFSAAVAGMLGRSTPDVQRNIEKNTARTNELLEELVDKDGLAFE